MVNVSEECIDYNYKDEPYDSYKTALITYSKYLHLQVKSRGPRAGSGSDSNLNVI